eukprot:TRINITY_DN20171_c0_g1_i2.p1 TRINITY_DN20171_c0_g1~~TRINITY_DN20171_c0_g1_i2.p1  ORF type:complete len:199 (+),score=22.57 TRINITY_DN20171_c0_g1_i2:61-597(+)
MCIRDRSTWGLFARLNFSIGSLKMIRIAVIVLLVIGLVRVQAEENSSAVHDPCTERTSIGKCRKWSSKHDCCWLTSITFANVSINGQMIRQQKKANSCGSVGALNSISYALLGKNATRENSCELTKEVAPKIVEQSRRAGLDVKIVLYECTCFSYSFVLSVGYLLFYIPFMVSHMQQF